VRGAADAEIPHVRPDLRRARTDDAHLRRAAATLIDRDFIVSRILQHKGTKMISVIPSGNVFWHNPNVPAYGEQATREERIRAAHAVLSDAGYTWETPPVSPDNAIQAPSTIRLPDGREMEKFTILTPPADYDPNRAMCGMMIQEWLRDVGMPAFSRPMAFSSLLQKVKARHDFDTFVLGYGKLSLDPDYVRIFFHSKMDKARGWNMSGYRNPEFDRMADRSRKEMDREKRRELLFDMQRLVLRDVPYIPLYNPNIVESVRNDRFSGWVSMIEGIGNVWSFTTIKPIAGGATGQSG
jgi:ABC-type transport system substrate-binding protein